MERRLGRDRTAVANETVFVTDQEGGNTGVRRAIEGIGVWSIGGRIRPSGHPPLVADNELVLVDKGTLAVYDLEAMQDFGK